MPPLVREVPKLVTVGICLALTSILFGFGLGGAFGAVEDSIKKQLDASGTSVLETAYRGDPAAKDAVVKKSFEYLIRAHLHGGAIGTAALTATLLLILLCRLDLAAQLSSASFGAGALVYSVFWLAAGFSAPGLGSTGAAKESLKFLAVPGAGLSILGLCGTIFCVVRERLRPAVRA